MSRASLPRTEPSYPVSDASATSLREARRNQGGGLLSSDSLGKTCRFMLSMPTRTLAASKGSGTQVGWSAPA